MMRWGALIPSARRFCTASVLCKRSETVTAFDRVIPKETIAKSEKTPTTNRFAKLYQEAKRPHKHTERHPKPHSDRHKPHEKHLDRRGLSPRPVRRVLRFKFETGTPQAQDAVKDIIVSIHSINSSYKVNFLNPGTQQIERKLLHDVVNTTDFAESGLTFIHPSGNETVPLVKFCTVQQMVGNYSRKLAQKKEKELLELGSSAAIRAANQRSKAEKKKSATKVMTMSWSISPGDLTNQKRAEILKRLNKNEPFVIYIGDRSSLYSVKRSADKIDGVLNTMNDAEVEGTGYQRARDNVEDGEFNLELKKKELVVEKLKEILEECQCQYEVSGNIQSRLAFKCSALPNRVKETTETVSSKDLRKQKKAKEQKEKKVKGQKRIVSEDDLDSLYLFKIEE